MYIVNDVHYFSNVSDFVQNVKEAPRIPGRDNSSQSTGNGDWSGTKTLEEAWDLVEKGDPRLLSNWGKMIEKIEMERKKITFVNSVVGHQVNVPLYLIGVPQHMIHRKTIVMQDKIINVLASIDVSAGTSHSRIDEVSAEVLARIVEMENAGYRVNLYLAIGGYSSSSNHTIGFIKLKSDKEPINLKKLVFPLTHPAMLRRLEFKFSESYGALDVTNSGYGKGGGLCEEVLRPGFSLLCRGQYYFVNYASYNKDWYLPAQMKTTVAKGWI